MKSQYSLFYVDRKVGRKEAYRIVRKKAKAEGSLCIRYGIRQLTDWVFSKRENLGLYFLRRGINIDIPSPLTFRQMQIDIISGRDKNYFCFVLISIREGNINNEKNTY